jgi:hypothetical protein
MKRFLALCLAGLWSIMASSRSQAAAPPLSDTFQGTVVNASLWTVDLIGWGPGYGQGGGQVAAFLPAYSAGSVFGVGYSSHLRLRGDFDMQVDFSLPLWPAKSGVRVDLTAGTLGEVDRISFGSNEPGPQGEAYVTSFLREGGTLYTATSDLTGKLRLVRSGPIVTGFRWDSRLGEWVLIHSGPAPTTDVSFGFGAWSQDNIFADQNVLVTFANFIVSQGTLVYPNGQPV